MTTSESKDCYENTTPEETVVNNPSSQLDYLTGWRLHAITLAVCCSLFLASLEVSIVSTALVSISNELKNFADISWVVAAYLLTYAGFLVIWARISDLAGRKSCLTTAITIFTIFSGACGAAQTSAQLMTLRAFQGLGGSGMTAVSLSIIVEMVPPSKYALYSSVTALSFAFSYLLGPLIGAAINESTTWRWVFLINVPAGVVNMLVLHLSMPTNFPRHLHPPIGPAWYSPRTLRRIDVVGCFLLFGASALIVACLEEAGIRYRWASPLIIVLLCICGALWVAFSVWELFVTTKQEGILGPEACERIFHESIEDASHLGEVTVTQSSRTATEPVFPWRFARNRVFLSMLLCAFAAGTPFTVSIITIPQRLQTVNSLSAFDASVRLLPFALGLPVGSVAQSTAAKRGLPCVVLLLVGGLFQVAGVVAQMKLPTALTAAMYGEQIIAGIGVGINIGILILWTPFQAKGADTSVGMSGITQIRALGGVVGVAIVTNIFNSHVRHALHSTALPPEALDALLQSPYAISSLPVTSQQIVQEVFADGYRKQLRAVLAMSVLQVVSVGGMVEREFRKVV